jgi:hypothetical protein
VPISTRPKYHAFISYSRKDSAFVDSFEQWLKNAGLSIFRDTSDISGGTHFTTDLAKLIEESRTLIAIVSRNSVESKWVGAEWEQAVNKQIRARGGRKWRFNVLPIDIDGAMEAGNIPYWLNTKSTVILRNATLDLATADNILSTLAGWNTDEHREQRDIYVSFGWRRADELETAAAVFRSLDAAGFRLIGDAEDHEHYSLKRVEQVMSGCGALVAVLPNRGGGVTSKYIVQEVQAAQKHEIPYVLFGEDGVQIDTGLVDWALEKRIFPVHGSSPNQRAEADILEILSNRWRQAPKAPYAFFSSDFRSENLERRRLARRMIERTTCLKCWMGDDDFSGDAGNRIADRIISAAFVVADISNNALNSCIEAGIAVGAGRELRLLSSSPRRNSPFMFRTRNIAKYANDVEMLGELHRLVFPFRRRVWNRDLEL